MAVLAGVMSWLHISAAVITVGGVTFVLFTLRPAAMLALEPPTMGKLMGQVALRFRWFVWAAIAVFIITGLWLATDYRGITSGSEAFGTAYGRMLTLKSALSLVLFASALSITLPMRRLAWFRGRTLTFQRLNAVLAFLIILLSALLVRSSGLL